MENIAPDIYRQRLLIEGFYTIELSRDKVEEFLLSLAEALGLRTYGTPVVYSPGAGEGSEINQGFDAFVPLIDSGISAYVWTGGKFFSILIYSCKSFDNAAAIEFTRDCLKAQDRPVSMSF